MMSLTTQEAFQSLVEAKGAEYAYRVAVFVDLHHFMACFDVPDQPKAAMINNILGSWGMGSMAQHEWEEFGNHAEFFARTTYPNFQSGEKSEQRPH